MATVLIHVPPLAAHVNQTFRLARDLQSRGHTVTYVSANKRLESLVHSHGLSHRFMPVGRPRSRRGEQRAGETASCAIVNRLRSRSALIKHAAEQLQDDRALRLAIEEVSPDLVLIDSTSSLFALPFLAWHIPVAMLSPTLPMGYDVNVPPLSSHFIPRRHSMISRVGCAAAWYRHRLSRWLNAIALGCAGFGPAAFERTVTRHYGLDRAKVIEHKRYLNSVLRVQELILCPEAFDFPRVPSPDILYADSSTRPSELESADEAKFPWHRIRPDMELVYCGFGSVLPVTSPHAKWLLSEIVAAFSRQRRFQLVLKVATAGEVAALGDLPEHVTVVHEWVPQLAILRRAVAHITHAGFMSVRESIECNVPMVAIPFHHRLPGDADHPGTAARIEYHGLGRRLRPRSATGQRVLELTQLIVDAPRYRKNVCDMKSAFDRHREQHSAADVIETLLSTAKVAQRG